MALLNANTIDEEIHKVDRTLDWLRRVAVQEDQVRQNSVDAGGELASVVYEYLQNPRKVGTRRLDEAYRKYMGLHAGNFHA